MQYICWIIFQNIRKIFGARICIWISIWMCSHMILSGLFKDYCVYPGDKQLFSICTNRKPNVCISQYNAVQCNAIQCIQMLQKINTWSLYLSRFLSAAHNVAVLHLYLVSVYPVCCYIIPCASVCLRLFLSISRSPVSLSLSDFHAIRYSIRRYNSLKCSNKKWDKRIKFGLGLRMANIVKIQQWGGDNDARIRDDKNKPISCKCWIDSVSLVACSR